MSHAERVALFESNDMNHIRAYFTPANANEPDEAGYTPLRLACHVPGIDNDAAVTHLLDCGASIHASSNGYTALHYAVWKHKPLCLRVLLDRGANAAAAGIGGMTPLGSAINVGRTNSSLRFLAYLFLEHGANIVDLPNYLQIPEWITTFVAGRERARSACIILVGALRKKKLHRNVAPIVAQWIWATRASNEWCAVHNRKRNL
jgi:hypothetical protein